MLKALCKLFHLIGDVIVCHYGLRHIISKGLARSNTLEHAELMWVDLSLDGLVSVGRRHVVVEEGAMGAAGEAVVSRDNRSGYAAFWTTESPDGAQHAVSLALNLILLSELSKDVTLPVEDILLPGLCGLALEQHLFNLLCLKLLSLELLPELWVVCVAFPLFRQVFDVVVEQGRVILLHKLRLKLLPLHTHDSLGRLRTLKSGEVRDITWFATSCTQPEVLAIAAIAAIVSCFIAPSDVNFNFRCCKLALLGHLLFARTVTVHTVPQKPAWWF